jgi:glycosyltransferase involved in cell wall biosynthesis
MNILSIGFPFAAVGPAAVGGAEQILWVLDHALVQHGHGSTVVARRGSKLAGRLVTTDVPPGILTNERKNAVTHQHQINIDRALDLYPVDLVHMHGLDFYQYRLSPSLPVLVTLHLPLSWYPAAIWDTPENYQFRCVSMSQRATAPAAAFGRLKVIENGVAIPSMNPNNTRGDFALVLSRICPEKNIHVAMDAGNMAGLPVWIGGHTYPYEEHLRYEREEIVPRLANGNRLLGPLEPGRKQRLLAAANCLLLPTLAPETSSLVAMEALAAGTPVIAFPSGAIPDIVEDGVTGFLVESAGEMARAIRHLDRIDPLQCRSTAAQRFCRERMIGQYLQTYKSVLADHEPGKEGKFAS